MSTTRRVVSNKKLPRKNAVAYFPETFMVTPSKSNKKTSRKGPAMRASEVDAAPKPPAVASETLASIEQISKDLAELTAQVKKLAEQQAQMAWDLRAATAYDGLDPRPSNGQRAHGRAMTGAGSLGRPQASYFEKR